MPANVYPARIDDLHAHLRDRFGVTDFEACDIVLACLLDSKVTGAQKPWIIIETDWLQRDCSDAWFNLGNTAGAQSLASARIQRHGPMEVMVNAWLESRAQGCAGIFVDPEWRRLAQLNQGRAHASSLVSAYGTLMAGCVRLRTEYPKTAWATKPADERSKDLAELRHLTLRVLDSSMRTRVDGSSAHAPGAMLYWCELVQKVSLVQRDWNMLVWSLSQVVRNVCTLYNQPDRPPDWRIAERLLRDCVNFATGEIVRKAHQREQIGPVDEYASPKRFRLERVWVQEISRLCRMGVLQYKGTAKKDRGKWNRLNGQDWYQLIDRGQRLFAS